MTSFMVNPNALQDAIDSATACYRSLVNEQDELNRVIAPVAANFVGQWGENWETEKQKWDGKANNVYGILFSLIRALETALLRYTTVGAAVTKAMSPGG